MQTAKSLLRKQYLRKRKIIIQERGNRLFAGHVQQFQQVIQHIEDSNRQTVDLIGSYIPTQAEAIPPYLPRFQYCYPRFSPGTTQMRFHLHSSGLNYSQMMGVKVPPSTQPEIIPQVILVPLVCFNPESKHRVGYGKGYYDRLI